MRGKISFEFDARWRGEIKEVEEVKEVKEWNGVMIREGA
jgi:hypothetical protein